MSLHDGAVQCATINNKGEQRETLYESLHCRDCTWFCTLCLFFTLRQRIGRFGRLGQAVCIPDASHRTVTYRELTLFRPLFRHGKNPLYFWLVFLGIGTFLGGLVSTFIHGRSKIEVNKGPAISVKGRLVYALAGGILVGFASRLGLGCTSGQGLAGAAMLSLGSWAFLFSVFFGGYATAYFVKDGWL